MVKMKKLIITIMVISILFTAGFSKMLKSPKEVYRVYLKGESIGLIKSKEKLEKYIHDLEMVPAIHSVERLIK